ncbi:hypothetical protein BJ138DRAFT_1118606 [Hygrophoropsis aurantiaca]|uniref:Uncharacterized protein n=1 Tax=Hygrophoropsis aurantiaca TaxID=72124 RepID=A0ACB7ZW28_9AGAM|nr:hypothetical protein BJ138DRAFT_1118606 [Hygrophoropsis aurantiaca]
MTMHDRLYKPFDPFDNTETPSFRRAIDRTLTIRREPMDMGTSGHAVANTMANSSSAEVLAVPHNTQPYQKEAHMSSFMATDEEDTLLDDHDQIINPPPSPNRCLQTLSPMEHIEEFAAQLESIHNNT